MYKRKDRIINFMKEDSYKPLLFNELIVVLDVPKDEILLFQSTVDELELEGKIFKTNRNRYTIPERIGLVSGRIIGNERGYAFLEQLNSDEEDIFIPNDLLNGAMDNDLVTVRINKKVIGDRSAEGEVVRITKRHNMKIVGRFEKSKNFGFVIPDNKRIVWDFFVPKNEFNKAKSGQKVILEVTKWPEKRRNPEGKIIEIIGNVDDVGIDILSVIKEYDLKEEFPKKVNEEVKKIPLSVDKKKYKNRKDLAEIKMVTIDGEDAKDLDDAVSIEKIDNGNFKLGVHIADVSHYVRENTKLDSEALKRGTSVYLVDRVIPMLPRELSNGICSLNPNVDRLSFSVFMEIDKNGKVLNNEIYESIINTNERMTYKDVTAILEGDIELRKRYDYLVDDFECMRELALILKNKRSARGAIDFNFVEAKVKLDEKGKPIEIGKYDISISNNIIEEFMIVCNETVSEQFFWLNIPFVYRIHESPEIEKIEILNKFLKSMGYFIKGSSGEIHPKAVQDVINKVNETKHEKVINTVVLRAMQKARYSNLNEGHFGLSAKYYSHFTSPIRRYPDLIIHRIMKKYLNGNFDEIEEKKYEKTLKDIAKYCSERERIAEEAERETEDLKKVEYMKARVGQVYKGIIANVTSFGIFIELDNTIEGMVKLGSLIDDYYVYDEKNYCLKGERTNKKFSIGDEVEVIVAKADICTRKIEFVINEPEKNKTDKNKTSQNKRLVIYL